MNSTNQPHNSRFSNKRLLPPITINNHTLSSPVYAAAIQDHFARSLSLNSQSNNKYSSYKPILSMQKRQLAKWNHEIKRKQKIFYGKQSCTESESIVDLERVLDPAPRPLTLAQKLGIVSRPKDRLTDSEWNNVKLASKDRCADKCPICCEQFTIHDQILLSCSHVYHRICLESYEKHISKKTCPICRSEDYEKRLTFEGKNAYLNRCAIKIQKTFRMWKVRKHYLIHLQTVPPSDPRLRRNFFLKKLSKISSSAESQLLQDTLEINQFLRNLDDELQVSRKIMSHGTSEYSRLESFDFDWDLVYQKAIKRMKSSQELCSICISPLKNSNRSLTLLNCSHVFHDKCISTFESFVIEGPHTCPVCRFSNYTRINFE